MAAKFQQSKQEAAEDAKELGNMSYELGELEEALSCYLEAISLDPDNAVSVTPPSAGLASLASHVHSALL